MNKDAGRDKLDLEAIKELMREDWSNNSCLGYVLIVLQKLNYPEKEIKKIIDEVRTQFDHKTVYEAGIHYTKSKF